MLKRNNLVRPVWQAIAILIIFLALGADFSFAEGSSHEEGDLLTRQEQINNRQRPYISSQKINDIDSYIRTGLSQINIPGLGVAIIEDGKTVYQKGFGIANSEGSAVTKQTSFELGSVSKSFTAIAIMQLVDEGRVDTEAPVINYIPWFQSKFSEKSDTIQVKHLLNHTSGFSTKTGNRNLGSQDNSADAYLTAISELAEIELTAEPGNRFQYSNTNYQILAYLLEVLDGESYEVIIQKRIFDKLAMRNSFAPTLTAEIQHPSQGYLFSFGEVQPSEVKQGRVTIAQGRLNASIEDLSIYLNDLLSDESLLVSKEAKQKILFLDKNQSGYGYGFGWFVSQKEGHRFVFHMGRSFGYESVVLFSPELDIGVVVVSNAHSGFGSNNVSALLRGIGDIAVGKEPQSIESPIIEKILLIIIYSIPVIIMILAVNFIRKYVKGERLPISKPLFAGEVVKAILIPSLALLAISYITLVWLPQFYNLSLQIIAWSEPVVFLGLLICASVAIIWLILRSVLLFRAPITSNIEDFK